MSNINIGSIINFRGREWIVMPSDNHEVVNLRPLTGGDADSCGAYLPLEASHITPSSFPLPDEHDIGDFESARLLRDASRLLLRQGAGPLRSMGHLSFRPRPYQFVPLLMALQLDPVRMLLADDVGIGKTIEAGLIARELLDRGEVSRLAVLCPPYLCDQWQRELAEKFNIEARIIRSSTLARLERDLPRANLNVFDYYPHIICSIDFVKSQRKKDAFLIHAPDLIIIDEAHGCARPAGQSISQQQRNEFITELAADRSKHVILVTATPHSGVEESFLSLLGFIDPEFTSFDLATIDRKSREALARHFIQRRRADVVRWMGTETKFPERESLEVSYLLSAEYKELFRDVYKFARQLITKDPEQHVYRRRVRYWTALALLRCVMSSPGAAQAALKARLDRMTDIEADENQMDYTADLYDPIEQEAVNDVVPSHVIADAQGSISDSERQKLRDFARRAAQLKGANDSKIGQAEEEIRKLLKKGFKPIVFCRFIATAEYVAAELRDRLMKDFPKLHVLAVTGLVSEEEREIQVAELSKSAVRLLVATDCLSEGINLQESFNAVLHYDLPWNPNRLEQREGRVDRFGQMAERVKTIMLYGADNPIDGAVLNVLLRKANKIHKTLGISVPVPMDSVNVMEAVLNTLFWQRGDESQLEIFADDPTVVEVHREWERAAEREQKSRTLFAQHGIKPDEVAAELDKVDKVLGSPEVVHRFVTASMKRLNSPLMKSNGYWKIDIGPLPDFLKSQLLEMSGKKIVFDQPDEEGVDYISRNHLLTTHIAEYLFDNALNRQGNRNHSARCSVIRCGEVSKVTTFLLVRLKFLIKRNVTSSVSLAEECIILGFEGTIGAHEWLAAEGAEMLFDVLAPGENLTDAERQHWLKNVIENFDRIEPEIDKFAQQRADNLRASYERYRQAIKGRKLEVAAISPVDLLAIFIVLPRPRV